MRSFELAFFKTPFSLRVAPFSVVSGALVVGLIFSISPVVIVEGLQITSLHGCLYVEPRGKNASKGRDSDWLVMFSVVYHGTMLFILNNLKRGPEARMRI